jgi:two-component system, sensor histidine kinase and response regulator
MVNSRHSFKADILIVDDIPDNLRLLSAMLTEQGYDVRSVTNGATALMGVKSQLPDLILLDIQMPGMNGYQVCEQLKLNPATQAIPVIFISGLKEVFDKVKAFAVGGVDYITKPFQVEEVLVRVESQLTLRRLQAQLQAALAQEKALNQRIEEMATIEERHRIARDIHDSLGHALVALNIQMETALALWQERPQQAYTLLLEAKQLGSKALQSVRESVLEIRSEPLQGKLLAEAIESIVREFQHTTGVTPHLAIDLTHPTSQQLNTAIYRIVQEGLTNICKYAGATIVKIQLQSTATGVTLILQDNGKGFDPSVSPTGFGLQGMQERVSALGGQLQIDSTPGAGCRLMAVFSA